MNTSRGSNQCCGFNLGVKKVAIPEEENSRNLLKDRMLSEDGAEEAMSYIDPWKLKS